MTPFQLRTAAGADWPVINAQTAAAPVAAACQGGQPELELVDPVPEDLQLGLIGQPPFGAAPQPRRGLGSGGDQRERHQPLRAVRAVDQPGRDLPGAVPAAQGGAGHPGISGRAFEGDPVRPLELGGQFELHLPVVQPVFPVHAGTSSRSRQLTPYY